MKKASMTTNAFNQLIEATKGFVSKTSNRPTTHYIRLEFCADSDEVIAIAVDGFKMSVEHAVCHSEENFFVYVRSNIKLPRGSTLDVELVDDEAIFRCDGFVFGYRQPTGDFLDWKKALPASNPTFRIGFNGDYLLSALQAAKVSVGGKYKCPVILEFRSPLEPVIIRTNQSDIKMVLPVRIKD